MLRKYILLSLVILSTHSFAQTKVTAGIMQGKEYGVTYTLPKSKIQLQITASKVDYHPGEFAKYASTYLHLEDISLRASTHWKLDKISISSIGVPDSEKVFFVRLRDKTVAPLMELTKDGIIKTINVPFAREKEETIPQQTKVEATANPRDYFTEEILMANSSAKMAELVAKEIYQIRESKNSLLRGESENMPQDGEQLKLMLDNLEKQENALTSLFQGRTSTTTEVFNIEIEPTDQLTDYIACRFSTRLGVLSSDNLAGEPITLSLKNLHTVQIPTDDGKKKVQGIAYNIPGRAAVVVKYNNQEIAKGDLPITQFGGVEYLAASLFNKRSKIQVYFDPNTGALLKVDQENL